MKQSNKESMKQSTGEFIEHAKQFALRAAAVFTVCGLLTGCAAQDGFARTALESRSNDSVRVPIGTNMADSSSTGGNGFFNDDEARNGNQQSGTQDGSAAYEKLLSYKTDDYLSLSVAEFNALIAPTRDAFGEALEAYAGVTISKEAENNDFFDVTLRASLSELYGEVFEEDAYFSVVLSRTERPYVSPIDGYVFYEFLFYANVDIEYRVTSPDTLTVAERDEVLRSCREELQSYVDGLSEEQILYGNIRAALTRKAAELELRYSGEGMELSIGIGHIDMIV